MQNSSLVESLIEAHIQFLSAELSQPDTLRDEFCQFYHWLSQQRLQDIWSFADLNQLLQQQILATPASNFLIEQIAEHIHFALVHPSNDSTTIEDVIPVLTIDKIAQYVASKSSHRQHLISRVVNHPAFSAMLSQLIQHSIQDYLDNSVMAKRVPGVSSFMKMGRSVLESVTESSLDETISHYLQKNILKLSQLSEHVLNQHFDDDKLYHFQANLWHQIKALPLKQLQNYIEVNDLPHTVALGHEIWDFIRQSPYMQQQLHDGLYTWYVRNQERTFQQMLRDLNIEEKLVHEELGTLFSAVMLRLIDCNYLQRRTRHYLEKFYYSESAQKLLNP